MTYKQTPKAVGLSLLAALCLMAFFAAGARGEGVFKINGSPVTNALGAQVTTYSEGLVTFLIPELNVEVVCNGSESTKGKLLAEGVADVQWLFKGCVVWTANLTEKVTPCKTNHATLDGLLLVVLHGGKTYLLMEPKENAKGELLPLVAFENEHIFFGCPLAKNFVLRGTVALELLTGDLQQGPEVVEPLMKVASAAVQTLLKAKLQHGALNAAIDMSAISRLLPPHQSYPWGAI